METIRTYSGEQMPGYWNRLKARWYRRGLDYSTLPKAALSVILPRTEDSKTFLDIGSGCGTLAIPLARAGKKVTALDASPAMIEILKEDIDREHIKNIKPLLARWGEEEVKPHDAILCANVPTLLKEPEAFLKEIDNLSKKAVFLIENADPKADKFYYKELYPLLFGKPFGERGDYFRTYKALHDMGIFANVEVIDYSFDQP
ncbi:MAG: class I SAM-dependent methyltransferase, partial [Deltaproteobacteria bacterium]|nr:class I SAM-dependent methyltransferase [Deltaproteobacteria bacterium]